MEVDELLRRVMDLPDPWRIVRAEVGEDSKLVDVYVEHDGPSGSCPECGKQATKYDSRTRRWRHLDLCNHQTWIVCDVPRVECKEHGVRQVDVPWADGYARFTRGFECHVIDWLKVASMSAVARNVGLSWDQVSLIQERAVERGIARREAIAPTRIGVDETSFQKRHEYVTIVTDLDRGRVLHVADGRKKASLDAFFEDLGPQRCNTIEVVAMDMHAPYIYSAATYVPDITKRLCFDRFHVAQLFSKAVDQVRRSETKRLSKEGDESLKGSRYLWLKAHSSLPRKLKRQLAGLLESTATVARVWQIKEAASRLWHYTSQTWATKAWVALCKLARSFKITELDRVIDTVLTHLFGIVNAITLKASNAGSESINSRVQALKRQANGYRRRDRFRAAILFHLGGLDLYPRRA